jgi:hypothetical protein
VLRVLFGHSVLSCIISNLCLYMNSPHSNSQEYSVFCNSGKKYGLYCHEIEGRLILDGAYYSFIHSAIIACLLAENVEIEMHK